MSDDHIKLGVSLSGLLSHKTFLCSSCKACLVFSWRAKSWNFHYCRGQKFWLSGAQADEFCMMAPNISSICTKCVSFYMHQAEITPHYSIAGPECGTCLFSPLYHLEFGCGSYIFGIFVDPCVIVLQTATCKIEVKLYPNHQVCGAGSLVSVTIQWFSKRLLTVMLLLMNDYTFQKLVTYWWDTRKDSHVQTYERYFPHQWLILVSSLHQCLLESLRSYHKL